MSELLMPSLGADMEDATVTKWLVSPGDEVKRGQVVLVVETVKGAVEVESFEAGVVEAILVEEGVKVPVGAPLARLGSGAAVEVPAPAPARTAAVSPTPSGRPGPEVEPSAPARTQSVSPAPARPRPRRMSPAARRRAREAGISPERVTPSRAGGPIVISDVERAIRREAAPKEPAHAVEPPPAPAPREETPLPSPRPWMTFDRDEMRRAIAASMSRSKREIPHFYLGQRVDLAAAERFRASLSEGKPPAERVLITALLLKASALALGRVRELNGHFGELGFEPASEVNLGVAIHLRGGGLVAPAILEADALSVTELMSRLADLVARARGGGLRASEMSRGTATVTALGERGVDSVIGVIQPPQVAMVGFGRVAPGVVVVGDAIAVHPVVDVTLAADHRVCDGHVGARFLNEIDRLLQNPEAL